MTSVVQLRQSTDYTGQQMALIKRTVAGDTNTDEFDLFMEVARRAGLDPFRKQVSAIVFSKEDPKKRKMSIITTIDGLRAIAARSGRYRPDEEEAVYEYDETLKGPGNPAGLVKASVTIHIADAMREGGWKPVKGWAYWSEYAPIKEEAEHVEWVDTGETYADSGKPKRRKVSSGAITEKVDGNWAKMPRVMLAKCAEAQAIRKAFPEDTSGLYERAELDRAHVLDVTASEIIGEFETETRMKRIGASSNGITLQLSPTSPLENIGLGKVADRIIDALKGFDLTQLRWFESANTYPLREFWARAQTDALAVKKEIEARRAELMADEAKDDAQ